MFCVEYGFRSKTLEKGGFALSTDSGQKPDKKIGCVEYGFRSKPDKKNVLRQVRIQVKNLKKNVLRRLWI